MPLVLELPAETEAQLRRAAARAGRGVEEWIIETARQRAAKTSEISLDEATQTLNMARAFILESVENGELSGETHQGEIFVLMDDKFEALREEQARTQAGLVEIARINSALGLYD